MNLVLYTGLLGGYLDPQGIEVVPHQDRPVKGFVQVSDCTKAHCVYLVSPTQICLFTLASTEAISTLQREGGEAGRLPPPLNNHLSTICWYIHGWNSTDKIIYKGLQHSRVCVTPTILARRLPGTNDIWIWLIRWGRSPMNPLPRQRIRWRGLSNL